MISAKFLWGNVFIGGKQQLEATSQILIFENALCMKSVSMPLNNYSILLENNYRLQR